MRLFYALTLPDEIRERLSALQNEVHHQNPSKGVRWVVPENLHLTLRFVGDVGEERLTEFITLGQDVAQHCHRFELTLQGFGGFPNLRNPRILWSGVQEGLPDLQRLAEYLNSGVVKMGLKAEAQPFLPHITLARIKPEQTKTVAFTTAAFQKITEGVDIIGVIHVYSFVLMQSELSSRGATYTALETFSLTTREG